MGGGRFLHLTLSVLVSMGAVLYGQQAPLVTAKLPVDDPFLHEMFLRFGERLESFHSQRKVQVSAQLLPQLDRDVAGVVGIAPAELAGMFAVTKVAATEVHGIEEEMRQHANLRASLELFPGQQR